MNKTGSKHLTLEDRKLIENLLSKNLTCKEIAFEVGKDDRSISREVRNKRIHRENGGMGLWKNCRINYGQMLCCNN